jgi:hypothetical protein
MFKAKQAALKALTPLQFRLQFHILLHILLLPVVPASLKPPRQDTGRAAKVIPFNILGERGVLRHVTPA